MDRSPEGIHKNNFTKTDNDAEDRIVNKHTAFAILVCINGHGLKIINNTM